MGPQDHPLKFAFGSRALGRMTGWRHHTGSDVTEASFASWDGQEQRAIKLEPGQRVTLRLESQLVSGSLWCEARSPDGVVLLHMGGAATQDASFSATVSGKYRVNVTAEKASGSYRLMLVPDVTG